MATEDTSITPSTSSNASLPPQADSSLPVSDLGDVLMDSIADTAQKKDETQIQTPSPEFTLDLPELNLSDTLGSSELNIDLPSLEPTPVVVSDSIPQDTLGDLIQAPEMPSEAISSVDSTPVEKIVEETQPTLIQEQPAPVQEQPAPVQEQPAPIQEQPTPIQEQPTPVQEQPAPIQEQLAPVPSTFNLDTLGQPSQTPIQPVPEVVLPVSSPMPKPVDIDAMLGNFGQAVASSKVPSLASGLIPPAPTLSTSMPTASQSVTKTSSGALPWLLTLLVGIGGWFVFSTFFPLETDALIQEAKSLLGMNEEQPVSAPTLVDALSDTGTVVSTGELSEQTGEILSTTGSTGEVLENTGTIHNAADLTGENLSGQSKLEDMKEVFTDISLSGQIDQLKTLLAATPDLLKKGKELQDREIIRNALYVRKKTQETLDQLEKGTQMATTGLTQKIQTYQEFLDKAQALVDASQTSSTQTTGSSQ